MKNELKILKGAARFLAAGAGLFLNSSVMAFPYNAAQVEIPGAIDNGLDQGDVGWGDFDADGDVDVLASGRDVAGNPQLRVYRNDGGGAFTVINVDGAGGGLRRGSVAWGDFDNDRDLDILANGRDAAGTRQLRVYRNNGNGTFDAAQVEVDGAGGGMEDGDVSWGDYDNDGDLDILSNGATGGGAAVQVRVYRNNGNGVFDTTQIEVDGVNGGLQDGGQVFGDIDGDGDLDVVISGSDGGGNRQLRAYFNNGNGTFNPAQTEIDGAAGGLDQGNVALADYDNDADLDILVSGRDGANNEQLRVYRNNGNGTFNAAQLEIDGAAGGLLLGRVAWGDSDNDGDLDILASGIDAAGNRQLRVYSNNGGGTFSAAQTEVDGAGGGLSDGGVAWADFDGDNKLDVLVNGRDSTGNPNRQLRLYRNTTATANALATAPTTLVSTFTFSPTLSSTATFKWNPGADGANSINSLYYDVDISTIASFTGVAVFPGNQGASPRLGSYNRPPRIFDGNTNHGVLLVSTYSYLPQAGAPYGLRTDTTYYYRVRTVDAGLRPSAWSATGALWTGVAPSTSTLGAVSTIPAQATMTWTSAGDDQYRGNLTGNYRLQYSTNPAAAWSTVTTPTDGFTVPLSTTALVPGTTVTNVITGLTQGATYYFVLWTQDDVGLWSNISNTTSAYILNGQPAMVTTLSTAVATTDRQITLNWVSPSSATYGTAPGYDIRWALTPITNDVEFAAATQLTGEPTPTGPGLPETMNVYGVPPDVTVYFAMKAFNSWGNGPLSNSASGVPLPFDRTQLELSGLNAGFSFGDAAWGDYNGDGLPDIAASGLGGGSPRMRVFTNLGGGTFSALPDLSVGLSSSSLVWGDYDGDLDRDLLATGQDGLGQRRIIVFRNDGGGAFTATNVVAVGGGLDDNGGTDWGDSDGDGDLDVLVTGRDGTNTARVRIYKNLGGGAFSAAPIELTIAAAAGGLTRAQAAWGDYDNDGKPDIAVTGINTAGTARYLRVFHNDGGDVFTEMPAAIAGAVGIENRALVWGDYNGDGRLDLLESGYDGSGAPRRLRVYTNNGGGTFTGADVDSVSVNGGGLSWGEAAFADWDMDGRPDIVAQGWDGVNRELRLYRNTGGAFPWNNKLHVDSGTVNGSGLYQHGAVSLADMDGDGDLDLLAAGNDAANQPQLRVYTNYYSLTRANAAPNAPGALASSFSFSATGTSTATFKWSPASDNAPNATPAASLTYEVQAATDAAFTAPLIISGGSFQTYPLIYDGNTRYGTVLTSTFPWTSTAGLMTDATYYFRVRTADTVGAQSGWSATGTLWTGVAPGTSTISVGSGAPGQSTMTWASAGDDANQGVLLTGNYRIQYSTNPAAVWSTTTTPTDGFTVAVPTATQTPGTLETATFTGLIEGATYYFVLWTQDAAGQWSAVSNAASAVVTVSVRSVTVTETDYFFGNVDLTLSTQTTTGVTVTYGGNANGTLLVYGTTVTAGSPWVLSSAPGVDQPRLFAGFNAAQPALGAFLAPQDVVLEAPQLCTATAFAIGQTCLNLAPADVRTLWFRLDMPTGSSVEGEQLIQVTLEAGPP